MKRIVVTGMGVVTPLASGVAASWGRLIESQSGIGAIEAFDVADMPCRIAGMVPLGDSNGTGMFDFADWVDSKEKRKMDEFIVFALAAADVAIRDSGWMPEGEQRERTGVIIGSGIGGLKVISDGAVTLHERGPRRVTPFFIPASLINLASGQVSIRHGFKGPNHSVVTACSSGAHAIGDAARMIQYEDADVMAILTRVNGLLEGWIREHPDQWMWMHRRWRD